jgi:hypothetical protein
MPKVKLKTNSLGRGGLLTVIVALITFLSAARSSATLPVSCWDAASEFNDSKNPDAANPSGVWSYGWKKTLTGGFFFAQTPYNDPPNVSSWTSGSGFPLISHLSRSVPVSGGVNPATFPPHVLSLHPGPDGEYVVLRFTAPADGTYKISGQFYALDDNNTGTTTDAWILQNDNKTEAFSGKVDYYGGTKSASFTSTLFQLKRGDRLDFQVGYGANRNHFYDSTGLNALIEKIK